MPAELEPAPDINIWQRLSRRDMAPTSVFFSLGKAVPCALIGKKTEIFIFF